MTYAKLRALGGLSACIALFWTAPAHAGSWRSTLDSAESLADAGSYAQAIDVGRVALSQAAVDSGALDTAQAHVLFRLAWYEDRLGHADSALATLQRGVFSLRAAGYDSSVALSTYLNGLGIYYSKAGQYVQSIDVWQQALHIREEQLGPDHVQTAQVLNNLGIGYRRLSRYEAARELLERALAIRLEQLGPDHRQVASTYNNLGNVASETGRFDEAVYYFREALRIKEQLYGAGNPRIGNSVNGLAIATARQGRLTDAEHLYLRALEIFESSFGPDHPRLTDVLNNLAILYFNLGRFEEAEVLDRRALEIRIERIGPESPDVAMSMTHLAHRLTVQGRLDDARPYYEQALAIRRARLGDVHADVARSLELLGEWYLAAERYAEAEEYFAEALATLEQLEEVEPLVRAYMQGMLAHARSCRGDLSGADSAFRRAAELMADLPEAFLYRDADIFQFESLHARRLGQFDRALDLAARAVAIRRIGFEQNAPVLTERDALTYSHRLRTAVDYYLSALADAGEADSGRRALAATLIVQTKGSVSDLTFARLRTLRVADDPETERLSRRLHNVRHRLSGLFVAGRWDEGTRAEFDSLQSLEGDLETRLARAGRTLQREPGTGRVTVDAIAAVLPADAALVEYVKYHYRPTERAASSARYLALVLRAGATPDLVSLGPARPIDDAVDRYRAHILQVSNRPDEITERDVETYFAVARPLSELILDPLPASARRAPQLMVAPDGGIHLVSFSGLITGAGTYLVEEQSVHYVTAARDVVRAGRPDATAPGLLAMGDPDFDCLPEMREAQAGVQPAAANPEIYTVRHAPSGCRHRDTLRFANLPGTRVEVERAAEQWNRNHTRRAVVYTRADASEEQFKARAAAYTCLHLATHGYYVRDLCAAGVTDEDEFIGEHPLLLSGLCMAGANHAAQDSLTDLHDDGILTALEVASRDLGACRLVVLSACETGLGSVQQGEGVYGLRRAFQMAGAGTVISALWRVSDRQTAQFMGRLYALDADTYPELLQQTARDQLRSLRRRGRPDHPYAWAGFIAVGDWRVN